MLVEQIFVLGVVLPVAALAQAERDPVRRAGKGETAVVLNRAGVAQRGRVRNRHVVEVGGHEPPAAERPGDAVVGRCPDPAVRRYVDVVVVGGVEGYGLIVRVRTRGERPRRPTIGAAVQTHGTRQQHVLIRRVDSDDVVPGEVPNRAAGVCAACGAVGVIYAGVDTV